MESPESIVEFWFGTSDDDAVVAREQSRLWWGRDDETDRTLRVRFGDTVAHAADGRLDAWSTAPRSALALILLLDQVPRSIHRGTPKAFAADRRALEVTLGACAAGLDATLRPIHRVFFYLPLEHSESLRHQADMVRRLETLRDEVPAAAREAFAGYLDWAERHREVIARFGRFPHRNAVLGRPSTPEELAFLQEPGSSF